MTLFAQRRTLPAHCLEDEPVLITELEENAANRPSVQSFRLATVIGSLEQPRAPAVRAIERQKHLIVGSNHSISRCHISGLQDGRYRVCGHPNEQWFRAGKSQLV